MLEADTNKADYLYPGLELELFANAHNWKNYYRNFVLPHIGETVLEVGAGIGGTTKNLMAPQVKKWVCLEPDQSMANQISEAITAQKLPQNCELIQGDLENTKFEQKFDSIVYIDVLEHIEDDQAEVRRALEILKPGGKLIILVPAWQFLYSPFDKAIGHFRRYRRSMLNDIMPQNTKKHHLHYLDSVGLLASIANCFLLKQGMPGERQIALWDRAMIPFSKVLDPLSAYKLGKSVFGVWEKI